MNPTESEYLAQRTKHARPSHFNQALDPSLVRLPFFLFLSFVFLRMIDAHTYACMHTQITHILTCRPDFSPPFFQPNPKDAKATRDAIKAAAADMGILEEGDDSNSSDDDDATDDDKDKDKEEEEEEGAEDDVGALPVTSKPPQIGGKFRRESFLQRRGAAPQGGAR
jgi:hypothetical protein